MDAHLREFESRGGRKKGKILSEARFRKDPLHEVPGGRAEGGSLVWLDSKVRGIPISGVQEESDIKDDDLFRKAGQGKRSKAGEAFSSDEKSVARGWRSGRT